MATSLPRFRSCLRRLFRGKAEVFSRAMIYKVAEFNARKAGATAENVLASIIRGRSKALTEEQTLEMRLALERDLPGGEP